MGSPKKVKWLQVMTEVNFSARSTMSRPDLGNPMFPDSESRTKNACQRCNFKDFLLFGGGSIVVGALEPGPRGHPKYTVLKMQKIRPPLIHNDRSNGNNL